MEGRQSHLGRGKVRVDGLLIMALMRFACYSVDSGFRKLDANIRLQAKEEVFSVFDLFKDKMVLLTYNLMATRSGADFLIWQTAEDLEVFENFSARLMRSGLGPYIKVAGSYFTAACTAAPTMEGRRHYLFLRAAKLGPDWSGRSSPERQKFLSEPAASMARHPAVTLTLGLGQGLDNFDLMLALEADKFSDFFAAQEDLMSHIKIPSFWDGAAMIAAGRDLKWILDSLG